MGSTPVPVSAEVLRAKFNRYVNYRTRLRATYDELLLIFREPSTSFKELAPKLGVTPERVAQIYADYFEPLCPELGSGTQRRWMRHAHDRAFKEVRPGRLGPIIHAAEKAKLAVQRLPRGRGTNGVFRRALIIEGQQCKIHYVRKAQMMGGRPYTLAQLPRADRWTVHIVHVAVPQHRTGILVIPAYVLNRVRGGRGRASAWIPLGEVPAKSRHRRIDWWKYEDAWRLLEGE